MKAPLKLILLGFLVGACSNNDFGSSQKLEGLRVLALQADKPEASPGDTVIFTPLVSDVGHSERTLKHSAVGCLDPGSALRAEKGCLGSKDSITSIITEQPIDLGTSQARTTSLPAAFSVAIPITFLDDLSEESQLEGREYLIRYTLKASDGTQVSAVKVIRVSTRPNKSNNPVLQDVLTDGSSLTSYPTLNQVLVPSYSTESATFPDGSLRILTTSWFVSNGKLSQTRTIDSKSNFIKEEEKSSPSPAPVLVVVTRDSQGGVSFWKKEF